MMLQTLCAILAVSAASTASSEQQEPPGHRYGVDVSFPMHYNHVSTNYAWLAHNRNSSLPAPREFRDVPIQPLGDRQRFYSSYLQGCIEYHRDRSGDCVVNEKGRIDMMLRQPKSMYNYTEKGYAKIRAPKDLYDMLFAFWQSNYPHGLELEPWTTGVSYVNHWESPTYMLHVQDSKHVGGGAVLQQSVWDAARTVLTQWTGQPNLSECSLYGIRVYKQDAILAPHVDRLPLVASAIINIDQNVDEPWPLEVIGRDGIAVNITMEPGDMVLYESHSIIHGRPFPLRGRFMANIFIHFEPQPTNVSDTSDLPMYIIPGSDEEANWRSVFPTPPRPIRHQEAKDAAKEGNTEFLKELYAADNSILHASDHNGWQPIHQAIRYGHVDTVKALVELGADVNQRTYRNRVPDEGGSPLYWAHYFWTKEDHPELIEMLERHGAKYVEPGQRVVSHSRRSAPASVVATAPAPASVTAATTDEL